MFFLLTIYTSLTEVLYIVWYKTDSAGIGWRFIFCQKWYVAYQVTNPVMSIL